MVRSHFVPRFYLNNFGFEIFCYDKITTRRFKSTSANVAFKKNFYGHVNSSRPNNIEIKLNQIEGPASKVIKKIIDTLNYPKLTAKEKNNFCSFVALQLVRTPEARIAHQQLLKSIDEHAHHLKADIGVTKYLMKGDAHLHLNIMRVFEDSAKVLGQMGVILLSNSTEIPLWTSDNPVTLHNKFDQFPFGNLGLCSKGIEVHIPLSPTVEICLYDPVTYTDFLDFCPMRENQVIHSNYLQTTQSTRFMYSNTCNFFPADEYLKSNLQCKDEHRARWREGVFNTPKLENPEMRKFHKRPEFWLDPQHRSSRKSLNRKS